MSSATSRPRAFVVGGARRVGRAIVLALAKGGCDVGLSYNTSRGEAEETAAGARGLGAECGVWPLSLDSPDGARAAAGVIAGSGAWDVLVVCASSYVPTPFERMTAGELTAALNVNAAAPALVVQSFVPALRRSRLAGGGAVVTMCDVHAMGETGLPRKGMAAYGMSKAALLELTLVLARELAPEIRVNGVAPGVVAWPERGPDSEPAAQARYLSRVPLGRAGTVEEAAEAVRWLALDATYCTGQVLRVDGGRSLG